MKPTDERAVNDLAERFTASELAHKLDASTTRARVARDRLMIAWNALRSIRNGEPEPCLIATTAMEKIKTP